MARIYKLGRFDWESDRADAVEKVSRIRHGYKTIRIYSALTFKGTIRKMLNMRKT